MHTNFFIGFLPLEQKAENIENGFLSNENYRSLFLLEEEFYWIQFHLLILRHINTHDIGKHFFK